MKHFIRNSILIFIFAIQYVHSSQIPDLDREIYDLFNSQIFRKLSINYSWDEKSYPVHFIYNPQREALFCRELSKPVRWPFAVTIDASSYPLALADHIRTLVPKELLKDADSVIDVADWLHHRRKNSVSLYQNLDSILLLNKIENCDIDAKIKSKFT